MQQAIIKELKRFIKLKAQNFNYSKWISENEHPIDSEEIISVSQNSPLISILVSSYNPELEHLKAMIDSVLNQTADNWELCIADASTDLEIISYLQNVSINYDKIHIHFLKENFGLAGNTASAINLSGGEYLALLEHDDLLAPNAIHEINLAIAQGADFIYSDEDRIHNKKRKDPHFKPSFNPWLLRSFNYICHLTVFKKSLYYQTDGFDNQLNGAKYYDIILKLTEKATNIVHVPKILYHWRINKRHSILHLFAKPKEYKSGKIALQNHLSRVGIDATVESHLLIPFKFICTPVLPEYSAASKAFAPKITIFVLSAQNIFSKRESITEYLTNATFYQDFEVKFLTVPAQSSGKTAADIINQAILNTTSEYIAFCDENIIIKDKNWLSKMFAYMSEPKSALVTGNFGSNTIVNVEQTNVLNNIANSTSNVYTVHADCILVKRQLLERISMTDTEHSDDLSSYISTQFSKNGYYNIWVENIYFSSSNKNMQSGYRG